MAVSPTTTKMFTREAIDYKLCGTCYFLDFTNPIKMFCRRYPAQLVVVDKSNIQALYPVVNPHTDWCGEHRDIPSQDTPG